MKKVRFDSKKDLENENLKCENNSTKDPLINQMSNNEQDKVGFLKFNCIYIFTIKS